MAFITVYNKTAPWKRLVIQLNILKYLSPRFKGDEGWMLYAKSDGAVDSEGVDVPVKIIGGKSRTVGAPFGFGWKIEP